jgi:outer membrane murein-binding lipoprotein Lpp
MRTSKRHLTLTCAVVFGCLLAGCSQSSKTATGLQTSQATVSAVVAAVAASGSHPGASASPALHTAESLVTALKAAGVPLSGMVVYTAETDPNHKLGRPGGYLSKAAFADTRVARSEVRDTSAGSVELGGGVEVFPTSAGAQARARYIQGALQGAQMLGSEYDYVAGGVLLRLSGLLTPAQAEKSAASLSSVTGTLADLVTP